MPPTPSPQVLSLDPVTAGWEGDDARLTVNFEPTEIGVCCISSFLSTLSFLSALSPHCYIPLTSILLINIISTNIGYHLVGVVRDVLTVTSPVFGEYVCDLIATCVAPLPQGPFNFTRGKPLHHLSYSIYCF